MGMNGKIKGLYIGITGLGVPVFAAPAVLANFAMSVNADLFANPAVNASDATPTNVP